MSAQAVHAQDGKNNLAQSPETNQTQAVQAQVVQAQVVQAPGAVAMGNQPKAVLETGFGDMPQQHQCQWCNAVGMTRVVSEVSGGTHLACLGICCLGCECGCCLIPYCVDACKEKKHFCTSCNQMVG